MRARSEATARHRRRTSVSAWTPEARPHVHSVAREGGGGWEEWRIRTSPPNPTSPDHRNPSRRPFNSQTRWPASQSSRPSTHGSLSSARHQRSTWPGRDLLDVAVWRLTSRRQFRRRWRSWDRRLCVGEGQEEDEGRPSWGRRGGQAHEHSLSEKEALHAHPAVHRASAPRSRVCPVHEDTPPAHARTPRSHTFGAHTHPGTPTRTPTPARPTPAPTLAEPLGR